MAEQSDIEQKITETQYAATSATGSATVNITNYNSYYREDFTVTSDKLDDTSGDKNIQCPYKGLSHFSPNDTELFFGREGVIQEIFKATQTHNFIPVIGGSGSGKTSVVLAGLVPKLEKEGNWLFAYFRPGYDPFNALAQALILLERLHQGSISKMKVTSDEITFDERDNINTLARSLKDKKQSLSQVIRAIQQKHPKYRLLLIADQFEELYTLPDDKEIRHTFLDCLLNIIQPSNSKLSSFSVVVATIRVDFLDSMYSYPPFGDRLKNDIKITGMNREAMEEAIIKPSEILGVKFEKGLVESILNDVKNEPGELTLLEFALKELWKERTGKQLTHQVYKEIGKVQGALTKYANDIYQDMKDSGQGEQVQQIFMQLVNVGGEGIPNTRRSVTKAQLREENWSLVVKLVQVGVNN